MKTPILFFATIFCVAQLAIGQNPQIKSLVEEGIALHDSGDYSGAIEKYSEALAIEPDNSWATYEMSYSYLSNKDYKNAIVFSKKVIKQNNGHELAAYIAYGTALDMLGKTSKSIKVYEKAMKDYDHYLLYYNHAISCFNKEKFNKSYESILKAIGNNPSHASSHLLLSNIMQKEGDRIKSILPLYYFLFLEPSGKRAESAFKSVKDYISNGVTKESDKNINVNVSLNGDSDFGAAEMMLSLSSASKYLEENIDKTEFALFQESTSSLFSILGELKKDNTGLWWDFYVPFFGGLEQAKLTEVYCNYIAQSQGNEAVDWINNNNEEFERFKAWVNK